MCKVIIKIYDVCLVSLLGSKFQLPGWPDGRNVPVWPASCKNSGLSYFPSQRHLVHVLITYSYRGNCVHVILVAERLGSLCQISQAFTHISFSCCSCTVAFAVLNLNMSTRCWVVKSFQQIIGSTKQTPWKIWLASTYFSHFSEAKWSFLTISSSE